MRHDATDRAGIGAEPGDSYHYRLIERAIAEIDSAGRAPLSLDDLAARLGMSAAHFQRIFSLWVGVSPKRFQQYLALGHARQLLEARATLAEAADGAGLSTPSRLHDLFLRWEAMTPGAHARRGAGLQISWGVFSSPFGPAVAMATDRGLCALGFAAEIGTSAVFDDLTSRWPEARYVERPAALRGWAEAALGRADGQRVPVQVIGAPFQIKVWEALLAIPSGHVTTYGDIARCLGRPRAMRAVGAAVGRNPLALLIPCHRVIARSGALAGYHWGLPVKRAMLARESARLDASEASIEGSPGAVNAN